MTGPAPVAGALTVGQLRRVILRTAAPTVGMMACHFCFNLIDSVWVGRLIGPAALGIGHKVEGLGFVAISGFSLAAAALVGQNLGAGREDRARRAPWITVGYCLVVTSATAAAFLLVPRTLAGLFTADAETIQDAALYLRVISAAQVGQSFELIFEGALAGAGYTVRPMVISTILTALRIPLAAWWSGPLGVFGIWLALSVTAVARGVAMTWLWQHGAWRVQHV